MDITRRTLLIGAGTGAVAVLLAACTPTPEPTPAPTFAPTPPAPEEPVVPAPAAILRSDWTTDPYARGAVSYLPAGADPQDRAALRASVGRRVFFAGEATASGHPGSVLGALESGRRAATAALAMATPGERIAVIGAGAAGAVAARLLADGGADVTVFEARDRTGGRVHTVTDDEWPVPVQLGAWLAAPEDLATVAAALDIPPLEQITLDGTAALTSDGEEAPLDTDAIEQAIEEAAGAASDVPLAEALQENGADLEAPALVAALAWLTATSGADPARASTWYPPALPPTALAGVQADLGAMVDDVLTGVSVALNSPVGQVAYDDDGVSLALATGEAVSVDRVVVTVPIGVLQHQSIEFAPPLPFAQRGAIASLANGFVECVWVRFDEPFGESDAALWHVVGGDARIRTWLNLQPATGEPILVGLVGGAAAEEFAALDDGDVEDVVRESLAAFAGPVS